jgi:NTE family protein
VPCRRLRRLLPLALGLVTGCGTYFPVNRPLESWDPDAGYRAGQVVRAETSDQLELVLAMSGGGTRAAAFAYGVLEELAATQVSLDGRDRSLLDEIDQAIASSRTSRSGCCVGRSRAACWCVCCGRSTG